MNDDAHTPVLAPRTDVISPAARGQLHLTDRALPDRVEAATTPSDRLPLHRWRPSLDSTALDARADMWSGPPSSRRRSRHRPSPPSRHRLTAIAATVVAGVAGTVVLVGELSPLDHVAAPSPTDTRAIDPVVMASTPAPPVPGTLPPTDPMAISHPTTTRPSSGPLTSTPIVVHLDGSPVRALAVRTLDTLVLTGTVRDASSRHQAEHVARALTAPGARTVQNLLTVEAGTAPRDIALQVIDLTPVPFADGATDLPPSQRAVLDRVAAVLRTWPNSTVLVIGHGDQRVTDVAARSLAQGRAAAVTHYLGLNGIAPERLSSRAVDHTDLIRLGPGVEPDQLQGRTEIIVFGVPGQAEHDATRAIHPR